MGRAAGADRFTAQQHGSYLFGGNLGASGPLNPLGPRARVGEPTP